MSVLVTGARGFLGRHLLAALSASEPIETFCSTIEPPQHEHELQCDLTDMKAVEALFHRVHPECIYHLAGSFSNVFEIDWANNVLAAKNILECLAQMRCEARLVVVGSAAEYGSVKATDNPVGEDHPTAPVSVYGLTKLWQTQLSQFYARISGVDISVARIFNLSGVGASEQLFVGRVERQIEAYKSGRADSIEVGRLDSCRDYLDVHLASEWLIKLMKRGETGEVYNIGSGGPVKMQDLLDKMLRDAGLDWSVVRRAKVENQNKTDVDIIYADIRKVQLLE